jgi:hypothetical protein
MTKGPLMMKLAFGFRWVALLVMALITTITAQAANHCIRAGATGKGDGSNWTDAWPSLQAAGPLVRGATYYLATGTYAGHAFSTPASGTRLITIKKAIGAEGQAGHGTDDGWVEETMGAGQAIITSPITISSSYWVIDGQKGAGFSVSPPDLTGANYGIAMVHGATCVTIPAGSGNITLSHIYGPGATNSPSAVGNGWFVSDGNTGSGSVDNITVSYCLLVGWGQAVRADKTWNNLLWEYNNYWLFYTDSEYHGNPINASWGAINNATVRYSLFYRTYGSGGLSQVIAANNNAWNTAKIYGNVFDQCWCGRAIISGNGHVGQGDGIYNSLVYNNTFLWSELGRANDGGGLIGDELSSGNTFVNNLAYACRATVGSSANDYNQYVATWNHPTETHGVIITAAYNPFKSAETQDYKLKTNTTAGMVLPAEYGYDAIGNPRTTWTRGAFELR